MKLFLTILALFAVSSASSLTLSPEQELESIADFMETVKKIYNALVEHGSEFVCSAKLPELLDILGLPDELDGAVELAQTWLCGSVEVLETSTQLQEVALKGFIDEVKRIYDLLVVYGKEFVCGTSIHELLDILGVPDELDGAVILAQKWLCGSSLVKRSAVVVGSFRDVLAKLKAYGIDLVCTTKLQDLLDILGLPDALDGTVKMAQDFLCSNFAVEKRSAEEQAVVVGSFIETVKRIIKLLKERGHAFVCSAKLQQLLDILGLPDALDGAVELAQKKICGDSAALVERSSDLQALQVYGNWFTDILAKLKAYGKDLVCTTKLQELLDILGLPDALDGAVKMAQDFLCRNFALVKREVKMTPEMHLQLAGAFNDTVRAIYEKLKAYFKGLVCSSRLHQLLDLLGLPDALDGAVQMAQKMICGEVSSTALILKSPGALEGFYDTVLEIFQKLVALGQSYVCTAGIPEILATLGLPDTLLWAVKVALDWFCSNL